MNTGQTLKDIPSHECIIHPPNVGDQKVLGADIAVRFTAAAAVGTGPLAGWDRLGNDRKVRYDGLCGRGKEVISGEEVTAFRALASYEVPIGRGGGYMMWW